MMKQTHMQIFTAAAVSLFALTGCSPDTQDAGTSDTSLILLKGTSTGDSVISKGVAFVDLDENGQLDSFEPFAITTTNGSTGTDTADCLGESPSPSCLLVTGAEGPFVVRVQGGYEKVSGVPFLGRFATRVERAAIVQDEADTAGATAAEVGVVSTLKAALDGTQAAALEAQLQEGDGLRLTGLLGALLGKVGVELDDSGNEDLVGAVTNDLTEGLAKELIGEGDSGVAATTDDLIDDSSLLTNLLGKVLGSAGQRKVLDSRVAEIAELARLVLWASDAIARENPGVGRLRVVQLLVAKAARVEAVLADLQRDATWVVDNPSQVQAFYEALDSGEYDLQGLVEVPLSGDGATLAERARIPSGTETFADIGGKLVDFSLLDEDDDVRVLLYFGSGDAEGNLRACLRYRDLTGDDGYETEGALIRGEWSRLDPYTIVAALNLLGSRESVTIRRLGEERYRFNFNGEFSAYSGPAPTTFAAEQLPRSTADCQARL